MDARQKCQLCGGTTEVGFVIELRDMDMRQQAEWWEGRPERSFWMQIKKPERCYKVTTLRCTKCGYLMEFANPDEASA